MSMTEKKQLTEEEKKELRLQAKREEIMSGGEGFSGRDLYPHMSDRDYRDGREAGRVV